MIYLYKIGVVKFLILIYYYHIGKSQFENACPEKPVKSKDVDDL
jgi:hypothetical protein